MRSRRVDYTESTRQALVDSALDLFTERGYAHTSLDAIVTRARVTKGALYHHFDGKKALFEAVFGVVETTAIGRLSVVIDGDGPVWDRAMAAIREYISICLDRSYQRIVIHEAPVVMGLERWREAEEHYSYGLVRAMLEALVESGDIEALPVETTARILFGALSAGAEIIAGSTEPEQAAADVTATITAVMTGMRRSAARA